MNLQRKIKPRVNQATAKGHPEQHDKIFVPINAAAPEPMGQHQRQRQEYGRRAQPPEGDQRFQPVVVHLGQPIVRVARSAAAIQLIHRSKCPRTGAEPRVVLRHVMARQIKSFALGIAFVNHLHPGRKRLPAQKRTAPDYAGQPQQQPGLGQPMSSPLGQH